MSREQTLERYLKNIKMDNRELIRQIDKVRKENKKLKMLALNMASDIDKVKRLMKGSDTDE